MTREQHLIDELAAAGVKFTNYEHPAIFTVEEGLELHASIPGAHTKNLFLKNDKGRFWLITIPYDRRADLKFIASKLGSGKLSFAKPDAMERLLGITPGAVSPLAAINDSGAEVQVVIDSSFRKSETISVHPLRNTATVTLRTDDLLAMLERWKHPPIVVDLQPEAV